MMMVIKMFNFKKILKVIVMFKNCSVVINLNEFHMSRSKGEAKYGHILDPGRSPLTLLTFWDRYLVAAILCIIELEAASLASY